MLRCSAGNDRSCRTGGDSRCPSTMRRRDLPRRGTRCTADRCRARDRNTAWRCRHIESRACNQRSDPLSLRFWSRSPRAPNNRRSDTRGKSCSPHRRSVSRRPGCSLRCSAQLWDRRPRTHRPHTARRSDCPRIEHPLCTPRTGRDPSAAPELARRWAWCHSDHSPRWSCRHIRSSFRSRRSWPRRKGAPYRIQRTGWSSRRKAAWG